MVGPSASVSSTNATNGEEETKKRCADSSNKIAVSPTTASTSVSSPSSSSSGPSTTFPDATSSRGVFKALIIEQAMAVHLPTIIQGSSVGMRSSLIPIFARALGGSDAVIGFITAVAGIGRVISAFPSGMMVTRFGFRETMSYGMYINCLGAAIAGLAWDNTLLVVASLVFGIGTGAFFTSRAVMLSHIVGRAQRGRLMSLVGGGERWSSVIGPFLGGVVIDYLGLRACCVAIIPVALLSVLCLRSSSKLKVLDDRLLLETRLQAAAEEERDALISHNHDATSGSPSSPNPPAGSPGAAGISPTSTKSHHHSSSPSTPKGRDLRSLFRNYGDLMVRIGVYSMIVITLRACRRLMLPLAAMNLGLSASMVGLVMSASFVVDATLFFLGGMVMDRFGRRYSAIPTTLNLAIGFFLLPFGTSTVTLFLVAMFFGVADSLGAGLLLTLNADHCPKAAGAEFMGLMRITQDMGQLVGPLFAGLLTSFVSFEFACWGLAAIGAMNAVWAALLLPQDAHDEDAPSATAATASPTTVGPTTATAVVVVVEPPHRCGAESPRDDQDELRSLPNGSFTGDGKRRPPSLFPPTSPFLLARAATATPPPHVASFPLGDMATPPSSALLPAVGATTAGRPPRSRQLHEGSAGMDFDNSSFTSAAAEPIVAVDVSNVVPRRTQLQ